MREWAVKSGPSAREFVGYFMKNPTHFYVLAGLVGMVQGGTQRSAATRDSGS